jgi:hypothetical protein
MGLLMQTIEDFEDILILMHKHEVRYLIVGGLAFIHYAKPRYTKDIDLWMDPERDNVARANAALAEFGSPFVLNADRPEEMMQLGVAPDRIDLIRTIEGMDFSQAWERRERGPYGKVEANWIDMDSLINVKKRIKTPRHQEDVSALLKVKEMKKAGMKRRELNTKAAKKNSSRNRG